MNQTSTTSPAYIDCAIAEASGHKAKVLTEMNRLLLAHKRGRDVGNFDLKFLRLRDQELADTAEISRLNHLFTGWSRFYLVLGGHIHSSKGCHTCTLTTLFSWLPELSGLSEADAVEAHGEILCSVCFPSAPVAWTNGVSKVAQAVRDERAFKDAAKAAAKAAKALFPDGHSIRVAGERIETKVQAQRWLSGVVDDLIFYPGITHDANDVALVLDALAEATDAPGSFVWTTTVTKRVKVARKNLAEPLRDFGFTGEQLAIQAAHLADCVARCDELSGLFN